MLRDTIQTHLYKFIYTINKTKNIKKNFFAMESEYEGGEN